MRNVGFIFQLQWQLLQLIKARNITHFLKSNGIFSKNVNQFFIYAFNKIISEVCVNNVIFRAWELTGFWGSPVNGRLTGIFSVNRLKLVKNGYWYFSQSNLNQKFVCIHFINWFHAKSILFKLQTHTVVISEMAKKSWKQPEQRESFFFL